MLQGYPISAKLPDDPGFGDRFWYWRGHSGQAYIHSIYDKESCPPLSDGVIVLVKVTANIRTALRVGRLAEVEHGRMATDIMSEWNNADEVHVHLLARDPVQAKAVEQDLVGALRAVDHLSEPSSGFSEHGQLALAFG